MSAPELKLALVPEEYPAVKLREDKKLEDLIRKHIDGGYRRELYPRFESVCYSKEGALMVACHNAESKQWIQFLLQEKLPQGHSPVKILTVNDLPQYSLVRVPGVLDDDAVFLKGLEQQNPNLSTNYWQVYWRGYDYSSQGNCDFIVDNISMKVLTANNMRLFHKLSTVPFTIVQGTVPRDDVTGALQF